MRKAISLLLKAAVSGLLLYFALRLVNLDTIAQRLRQVRVGWLALSVVMLVGQTALLALRWQQIVRQCGASMPFMRLFRFTMIGTFFNQTLPSSVGGDAMRIWLLGKQHDWRVASYSVLLDRMIGLVVLACVVVVCLPWTFALVQDPVGRIALLVIGLGSLAGWVVFLVLGWERWRFLQRWSLTRHVAATRDGRHRHPAHAPHPGVGRADLGDEPHADGAVRLVRRALGQRRPVVRQRRLRRAAGRLDRGGADLDRRLGRARRRHGRGLRLCRPAAERRPPGLHPVRRQLSDAGRARRPGVGAGPAADAGRERNAEIVADGGVNPP